MFHLNFPKEELYLVLQLYNIPIWGSTDIFIFWHSSIKSINSVGINMETNGPFIAVKKKKTIANWL